MTDPSAQAAQAAQSGQAPRAASVQAVEAALAAVHRREWGRLLAAAAVVARDLDLAEECVQEAYAAALRSWADTGIPQNPAAWLSTAAKRRAVDAIRRESALRARLPLLVIPPDTGESAEEDAGEDTAEARPGTAGAHWTSKAAAPQDTEILRLIFTCCHPALSLEAQVALTLRLVCGMTTPDIARAFLVTEPTMAARITRAKKKIAGARIPFRIPAAAALPERLGAVLNVIHLLFTAGHTAPSGPGLVRADLTGQSLRLTALLRELMPDELEVRGLHALLLVTDARRATRTDSQGRLLRLEDQDRSRWDRTMLAAAENLITGCLRAGRPGRYVLQAAIASLYADAPSYEQTDWPQLVTLYDELISVWPSPVAALNRAVPLAVVAGPGAALAEVERLERDGRLAGYRYLPAVKADLLARLNRPADAAAAYETALGLTANEAERAFLAGRLAAVTGSATVARSGTGEASQTGRGSGAGPG
jgi:RNA polymerase sigma-70 factor (ECF subfamily)